MAGSKTEAERMEISQQNSCRFSFTMPEDGFAELDLTGPIGQRLLGAGPGVRYCACISGRAV
ncbi:hypothetical protein [Paenibacillus medicaginis]|uniref:Uncharacterized protein n=1 Tax=Paenibacillus medicaginis TaxID=1470560 RepID=A0ABV5C892_9BACL